MASPPPATHPPALLSSEQVWQADLRTLFDQAKDRFADITWDVGPTIQEPSPELDDEDDPKDLETIWGHKAIIYARAPPAFQYRYFPQTIHRASSPSFRSPSAAYLPYPTHNPYPAQSHSSLRVPSQLSLAPSFASSYPTRIRVGVTPQMFKAELEWLYTGEGMGEMVEWLSLNNMSLANIGGNDGRQSGLFGLGFSLDGEQSPVPDTPRIERPEDEKRERLRNDLVYMWRSKLYSDIKLVLPFDKTTASSSSSIHDPSLPDNNLSDDPSSSICATFSTHKFILASRSPYFASLLLNPSGFQPGDWGKTGEIELFSPPFTPASIHFCLGFMYAGTLSFSNRSYDLQTAFDIHRAATYLQLYTLRTEIEYRITHEMCADLNLSRLVVPSKVCARRVPRVWRFATAPDVGARDLEVRAREWIVVHWGECWGRQVGEGGKRERDGLVRDVLGALTPSLAVAYYRAVRSVRARTESERRTAMPRGLKASAWSENLLGMVLEIEGKVKGMWVGRFREVVESDEFTGLLLGTGFERDLLESMLGELTGLVGGLEGCKYAGRVYQDLVNSLLLRVDPTTNQPLLPSGGAIRTLVENTRVEIIKHLRKRWMQVREKTGFVGLETWALKEISDEIDQPVQELVSPPISPFVPPTKPPPKLSSSSARSVRELDDRSSVHSDSRSPRDQPSNGNRKSNDKDTSSVSSRTSTATRATTTRRPRISTLSPVPSSPSSSARATPEPSSVSKPICARKDALPRAPSTASLASRRTIASATYVKPASGRTASEATTASKASAISSTSVSSRVRTTSSGKTTPNPSTILAAPSRRTPSSTSASTSTITRQLMPSTPTTSTDKPPSRPASVISTLKPTPSTSPPVPKAPSNTIPLRSPIPLRERLNSTTSTLSARSTNGSSLSKGTSPVVRPKTISSSSSSRSVAASTVTTRSRTLRPVLKPVRSASKPSLNASSPDVTTARRSAPPTIQNEDRPVRNVPLAPPVIVTQTSSPNLKASTTARPPAVKRASSSSSIPRSEPAPIPISPLLSPTYVKRPRTHPAASFDPPKRPAPPRPTPSLAPFAVHALHTLEPLKPSPGISLYVGIPCIVSLPSSLGKGKKVRCRAFARYIGSLVGRPGAWVGVELVERVEGAVGKEEEEAGCLDGVRYFQLGALGGVDGWEENGQRRRASGLGEGGKTVGSFLRPCDVVWVKGA